MMKNSNIARLGFEKIKWAVVVAHALILAPVVATEPGMFHTDLAEVSAKTRKEIYAKAHPFLPFPFSDAFTSPLNYHFFSTDSTLYFSASFPDSYGKSDLYMSKWENGEWGAPQNLGTSINTIYSESYPYFTESGKLLFSSDRKGGYGGLDNYYSILADTGWMHPVLLDSTLNSSRDDYALISFDDLKSGYFTSDKASKNTLYGFSRNVEFFNTCSEAHKRSYCYTFTDNRLMPPDSIRPRYEWTFSTGDALQGKEVTACFPHAGEYQLILRVIDEITGDTLNAPIQQLVVIPEIEQPVIHIDAPYRSQAMLTFDASDSYLPQLNSIDYIWDFGDDTFALGMQAVHAFHMEGHYTIKLAVTGFIANGQREHHCIYQQIEVRNE